MKLLNGIRTTSCVLSVLVLSLLWPHVVAAQQPHSFSSLNFPKRYIRHRNFLGFVDEIGENDRTAWKDATFRLVPGLAGKCTSFESVNFPGHFLRHENYRVKLAPLKDDPTFRNDATFCLRDGLGNSNFRSFESVNFPHHYIRHLNFELWLAKFENNAQFRKDASFLMAGPLAEHGLPKMIDPGTNTVPSN
jgi:hypothetical protein